MKLAESRINELRQQVANLQSPEPEKVRAAYEALTVNARENAKALLAVLDAPKPVIKDEFLQKLSALVSATESADAEEAAAAHKELAVTKDNVGCIHLLIAEIELQKELLGLFTELVEDWVELAGKTKWRPAREMSQRTLTVLKHVLDYAEARE